MVSGECKSCVTSISHLCQVQVKCDKYIMNLAPLHTVGRFVPFAGCCNAQEGVVQRERLQLRRQQAQHLVLLLGKGAYPKDCMLCGVTLNKRSF